MRFVLLCRAGWHELLAAASLLGAVVCCASDQVYVQGPYSWITAAMRVVMAGCTQGVKQ